jgi:hypothetical protein
MKAATTNPEARFDRRAWLTLGAVVFMLAIGLGVLAFRFTLPTDGWKVDELGEVNAFVYISNQMGAPSGLRPGEVVVAVEGFRLTDAVTPALQQRWRVGETLTYTVVRNDVEMPVTVTLTRWDFGRWLLATLSNPGELFELAATYLLLGIAALVFWRRPGNVAAGAFLLLTASLATTDLATGTLSAAWPESIVPEAILFAGPVLGHVLYSILLPFVLIRFGLVFPHPKPMLRRWPWLAAAPILVGIALGFVSGDLSWMWFVIAILIMLALLAHKAFTARDAVSRAQVLWGLSGLLFGFGLLGLMLAVNTFGGIAAFDQASFSIASAVAFTVIGLTLGIAITRYRLFEIDVIIRRTLVYAAITAVLALVYFGSVVILQGVVRGLTGGESPLVIVLSTLLIAALFAPVRARVQRVIDRRFYRRKYDAARTLAAFGTQARDETDLARLSNKLQGAVQETMQPAHVELWLQDRGAP